MKTYDEHKISVMSNVLIKLEDLDIIYLPPETNICYHKLKYFLKVEIRKFHHRKGDKK